jgi:hypothetical protein
MRTIAIISALLIVPAAHSRDYTAPSVARLASCDFCESYIGGKTTAINLKVLDGTIYLGVTSSLACGAKFSQPELIELGDSATVRVSSSKIPSAHDGCDMVEQQSLAIAGLHQSVKTIYYLQDGAVLGHVHRP